MKKGIRMILGVMLSASMTISPVMEAVASNQFYSEMEDVAGELIFPGDSIYGAEPIYLGPDGTVQEITDGVWTNRTEQAFEIGNLEGEEEGLWLQPMGYVLTVKGGTCQLAADDDVVYNHYQDKEVQFDAVTGSKGYRWLEAEEVKLLGLEDKYDRNYFDKMIDDAIKQIQEFGSFDRFVDLSRPYVPPDDISPAADDNPPWSVVPCGDGKFNDCLECPHYKGSDICGRGYSLASYIQEGGDGNVTS